MRKLPRFVLQAALSLAAPLLPAHEFWMLPASFQLQPGQPARLSLFVGEKFAGVPVAFAPTFVSRFRQWTVAGAGEVPARTQPGSATPAVALRTAAAGTYLFALDTHPNFIELPAERFTEYLRQEGLQQVILAREGAGTTGAAGRERYRRNVKTLVRAGAESDRTYAQRTMQRLEIVPLSDPFRLTPPAQLAFEVFFDDRPLPRALLKLWHRTSTGLTLLERVTGPDGRAEVVLPEAGVWMASVVHMVPLGDTPGVDWDSYWGNLTFAVP